MSQRVLLVGCGAVGGILAARLTRAGVDVLPVTGNEAITTAIESAGFEIDELDGTKWRVPASSPPRTRVTDGPAPGMIDLCVVCTKTTTLEPALREVMPYLPVGTPVVVCQNGLPEDTAARVAGSQRVLGCVVAFGGTMTAPGKYQQTVAHGSLQVGRPFADSPTADLAVEILGRAFPTRQVKNLTPSRWTKLAVNCATSTLGAIGGERLGTMLRRRFVRRLVLELWTEIAAVAQASDVRMARFAGALDIHRMALTPFERQSPAGSPVLALKHSVLIGVAMKYRRMRSSMLVAIERGRTPEIHFLNGEIVRRGAMLGVPTPVNQLLVETVERITRKELVPSMTLLHDVALAAVERAHQSARVEEPAA